MSWLPILLMACADPAVERAPERLGPISDPLPGNAAQDHATLACDAEGCVVARRFGTSVRVSLLDDKGRAISQTEPATPPDHWNHPEIARDPGGWLVLGATLGAPHAVLLDRSGQSTSVPSALHPGPLPRGLWPDLAVGDDGRALAVWSTRAELLSRVFVPTDIPEAAAESVTLTLPEAAVDPPATAAVPGGYVRAWTEMDQVDWQVQLDWIDLDGRRIVGPVTVAAGTGESRGARPHVAADSEGNVAVVWRIWTAIGVSPEGAWLRTYRDTGEAHGDAVRLDLDAGDRPTVEALPDGWLVAWEEGTPAAVWLQERQTDGSPRSEPQAVSDAPVAAGRPNLAVHTDGETWRGFVSWEEVYAARIDAILDSDVRVRGVRGP